MKKMDIIIALVLILINISCTTQNEPMILNNVSNDLQLIIQPDSSFYNTGWFLVFPYKKGPQIAVWVEDKNGEYIQTLYVTKKVANNSWLDSTNNRPEALPVWSNKRLSNEDIDSVTGATGKIDVDNKLKQVELEKYKVCIEVNISYDWNNVWQKGLSLSSDYYNGDNGQPSLVYMAEIDASRKIYGEFKIIGHGSPTGKDGKIYTELVGIDSAMRIIKANYRNQVSKDLLY